MGTTITYAESRQAWKDFPRLIRELAQDPGTRSVCEVGAGARPALDIDLVTRNGLEYTVCDISAEELAKAPPGYQTLEADIAGAMPLDSGRYDLVFSKTLVEHVADAERAHANVYAMLREGGTAVHMFPTLYAPAFVVNLLLPTAVTRWLLTKVQGSRRDDQGLEGKFPAFYRWCRGPSAAQLQRLRGIGYEVVEYRGYFGTPGYYRPLRLAWLDKAITTLLLRRPVPALTSYAVVVLRRPRAADGEAAA